MLMDEQRSELNHKRELFARAYLKHGNGAQAVIDAGYDVSSRESASSLAYNILQDPSVQQFLSDQRFIIEVRNDINLDWTLKKLKEIVDVHTKLHESFGVERMIDARAALSALDMICKKMGYYAPQKVEHKVTTWQPDKEILQNFVKEF